MQKILPWLLSLIKTEIQCKRHKLNSARSIKNTVQEEIKWFAAPYDIPATVHWPATSSIEQLKDLLYSVRYDKVILPYGTSPNKLSTIWSLMVTHWDGLFPMGSLTRFTHLSGWLAVLKWKDFQ